jgi:hypothetical protein
MVNSSSATVTYPRNASTGVRTVAVRLLTRFTATAGTRSRAGLTCSAINDPEEVPMTGPIGAKGSTGRASAFDVTVGSGGPTVGPSAQRQVPVTIALRYSSSLAGSLSGNFTTNSSARPTVQRLSPP